MIRRLRLVVVAAALALGAVSCGGADNGGVIQGPTTTAGTRTGVSYGSGYSG